MATMPLLGEYLVVIPNTRFSALASKQLDHCLSDLLYRWQEGRLPLDINIYICFPIYIYYLKALSKPMAFNVGVKLIGSTSHFVKPELDAGRLLSR
ncbi:hypothetical protein EJB05_49501, partial [Eragrostis curvula]